MIEIEKENKSETNTRPRGKCNEVKREKKKNQRTQRKQKDQKTKEIRALDLQ